MKNIHLLPTDKPSILGRFIDTNNLFLRVSNDIPRGENVNIYITSDEEIKEGDVVKIPCGVGKVKELIWKFGNDNPSYIVEDILIYKLRYGQKEGELQINSFRYEDVKKIILTTDQDLINDGIQAIGDEFLEWLVKNPSCEWVEVGYGVIRLTENDNKGYWISIPNAEFNMSIEEPKQEIPEERKPYWDLVDIKAEQNNIIDLNAYANGVEDGVKWQQEQDKNLYSEEEVRKMFSGYNEVIAHRDIEKWQPWIDKQFKKK